MSTSDEFKTPVIVIKGAVCSTCLNLSPKLNRCRACKRVFYCSAQCQKKDWKNRHRKLCPVLSVINAATSTTSHRTWNEYRNQLRSEKSVVTMLRLLYPQHSHNDERIVGYQPHCVKCHRNTFELKEDEKLTICGDCKLVHHCTACNTSVSLHEAECPKLQEVYVAEAFAIQHYLETGETTVQMPTQKPRQIYIPLSTAESWYDYFTKMSGKTMVTGLLSHDLRPLAGNDEMASALRASTERNSTMLTIIAALEVIFRERLATITTLNLHLIGADSAELDALMLFEEILHLLPALKTLDCSFVGLDLPRPLGADEKLMLDCCDDCTRAGRTRSIYLFKGAYHNFIKTNKYSNPDLAIALQTGHAEVEKEAWTPTIQYLAKEANHGTLFTAWNEKEMRDEVQVLQTLGAKFVIEGQQNKWRGMRPMLEMMEEKENDIYYAHYYCYVIAGKSA